MSVYYNENDPFAAAWLRELIKAGHIAPGEVDERSIEDVKPKDIKGFTQCHWFGGIGGWSYALRLAGWKDSRPCWTGSCPCQPFSQAGKRRGNADERHLWPAFHWLIQECRPSVVFGEQVASKDGRVWLAGVRSDLEALGYGVGAADLCAASVSAPHIRQRLYWLAGSGSEGRQQVATSSFGDEVENGRTRRDKGTENVDNELTSIGEISLGMANSQSIRYEGCAVSASTGMSSNGIEEDGGNSFRLDDSNRYHEHWWSGPLQVGRNCIEGEVKRSGRKYRAQWRIKPDLSLLAHGVPGRVGKLCGLGNAIVPQVAAEFIRAYTEIIS